MGYMHINNLYKTQDILIFKECYALEKVHGTSAQIDFVAAYSIELEQHALGRQINQHSESLEFFGGSVKPERFKQIVLEQSPDLLSKIKQLDPSPEKITIYGEAYGGSIAKGMSATYGKDVRFIVFDVQIGDKFLAVPQAEEVTIRLGLEFVPYSKIPATIEAIEAEKMAPSLVAVRHGMGIDKLREGVVLRPLIEVTKNNGDRVMCKHKHEKFEERMNPPKVDDPNKMQKLEDARKIADEWVTPMRLEHVLDKIPAENKNLKSMKVVIDAMIEDVYREAKDEIVESREVSTAIGGRTAKLFKEKLLNEEQLGGM